MNPRLKTKVKEAVLETVPTSVCHNKTRLCYDDITSSATLLDTMEKAGYHTLPIARGTTWSAHEICFYGITNFILNELS